MIRIFFDTEFSGLIVDPKLISIGLISEHGERSFYAELTDTWNADECDFFVQEAVLPLLEGGDCCMTMAELGQRLTAWLASFDAPVQLATDSLAWDWLWVQEIFHEAGAWPANLDGKPLLLTMNYLIDYDAFNHAIERAYSAGLRRHHALDDAKANRIGWIAAGGDVDQTARATRPVCAVCLSCGTKHGRKPVDEGATWYDGPCDICGVNRPVTQPRDFGM